MNKLMVITPHLSTGGSPQYLLEYLKTFKDGYSEVKVIEFTNFSDDYVIQKNKIKELIGEENVICLGEYSAVDFPEIWYSDKMKLIPIIEDFNPNVVWMNEFPENYEYKLPPDDVMDYIYREDRSYKLIETTHYNSFDFNTKKYFGDEFMLCSPHQMEQSSNINIEKHLWEIPITEKERINRNEKLKALGLDPSYVHILHVGLFHVNKNQKYIFGIANEMRNDKVMFHFIGNDCFLSDCNLSTDELNLSNYKIWGERSDVDTFMSCMDIYLFPSIKELNPITVREALSNQMDVIVNRDTYVNQYKSFDNFYIIDEIDVKNHIRSKMKKFLIVSSFYNKNELQIKRTIDSIRNQSYTNWELIIGDDFSDNNCKDIILEYINEINDDRISFYDIAFKFELYLYQNFFKEREYDYFFDLDSDDIPSTDILDIYQKHFVEYPEINSIFCDFKVVVNGEKLERYALVRPSSNLIEDFNVRTYEPYINTWGKCSSWSLFGMGRCFRKSIFDKFEIDMFCKTATDSMVFFNSLIEGTHLHIPMNLYTYDRRVGSDSFGSMTSQEHSNYNVNTLKALNKFKETNNTMSDIYDDVYQETSAIIMADFGDDVEISIITNITDRQKDKLNFLYGDRLKINDFTCDNIIVIKNKVNNFLFFENKNMSYYQFFDDFNIAPEKMEEYLGESSKGLLDNLSYDNYFHYFRHMIVNKKKKIKLMSKIENDIHISEFEGIKIEILGDIPEEYFIEFIDKDTDRVLFSDRISNNMWSKANPLYYVNWMVRVNGNIVYEQNLNGKNIVIEFGSSSLGDTIAWFPYLLDFREKHQCEIFVMTYKNWLFKGMEEYKDITFIEPGEQFSNINKKYNIGWYYQGDTVNSAYCENDFKAMPLQQTVTDILGLTYQQKRPLINMSYTDTPPIDGKYVCIAIHSTAQAKYWNHPKGWQTVVDYLKSIGYEVVLVSKENDGYMGNFHPRGIKHINGDINEVSNYIKHSDFFIGVSSGLTWLAWAINVPIVLISGFTLPYTEFLGNDIQRIINTDVCHGCFNKYKLDPSDWNWCPVHKGTSRQFECSKKIHPNQVIVGIDKTINYINTL